jgi:MarR family transcriptional regulator, temperature-dependent positive regulator of motility
LTQVGEPAPRGSPDGSPLSDDMRGPTARVGHLLRRAYQMALEKSARAFADLDITPRQAGAIWELHVRGPLSQRELGESIGMDAPNVHSLVTRLLKRGVVARAKDENDPRRKRLSLTAEGTGIAIALPERARRAEEATLASLPPADRAKLVRLLAQMAAQSGP